QDDAAIGLPDEHLPPHAFDPVDAALVPAAARARLDHDRGAVGVADVVRRHRRPRLDPRREDLERERDRRGDGDGLADGDLGGARERWVHGFSFAEWAARLRARASAWALKRASPTSHRLSMKSRIVAMPSVSGR